TLTHPDSSTRERLVPRRTTSEITLRPSILPLAECGLIDLYERLDAGLRKAGIPGFVVLSGLHSSLGFKKPVAAKTVSNRPTRSSRWRRLNSTLPAVGI